MYVRILLEIETHEKEVKKKIYVVNCTTPTRNAWKKKRQHLMKNTKSKLALHSLLLCKHFEVVDVVFQIAKLLVANKIRR